MTLLSIIQDASDEVGITRPSAIITNADTAIAKMLRMAKRVGLDLAKRGTWTALRSEVTFTATAAETQASIIPADFDRFIPEAFWDRTSRRLISGPLSAVEWQSMMASASQDWSRFYTLRGGAVLISPTMAGGESMAFEYMSRNYCQSAGGVAQATWQADTDTGRLSEELFTLGVIAFYLRAEGQPHTEQMQDYEAMFSREHDADWPDSGVLLAGDIFGERRARDGAPAADGGGYYPR